MTLQLRLAHTDADLQAWRAVRLAVLPEERCSTVDELRGMARPGRYLLLAERAGALVGHGVADRSDLVGRAFATPRVLPEHRGTGVGSALLADLAARLAADGHERISSHCDDEESLRFANRRGFVEVARQVEQIRPVGDEPRPEIPAGLTIVTVAEQPQLWARAYHEVGAPAMADMAVVAPMHGTLDEWEREWMNTPEATFLALSGDEIVGLAGVLLDADQPHRGEQGFTAVRRDWRGRRVAATLKRMTLWWAARHGLRELYTWTQQGNADMRRLNERLGFTYRAVSINVEAALPLDPPQ
jgi:GNAT superfamily N-acetyltransferase